MKSAREIFEERKKKENSSGKASASAEKATPVKRTTSERSAREIFEERQRERGFGTSGTPSPTVDATVPIIKPSAAEWAMEVMKRAEESGNKNQEKDEAILKGHGFRTLQELHKQKLDWEYAQKAKKHPITLKNGMYLGEVSYDALKAMQEGEIDEYFPKSIEESETISKYKTFAPRVAKEERINSNPVFARYGIDPLYFDRKALDKWAKEHHMGWNNQTGEEILMPIKEGSFLGFGGKNIASDQEIKDSLVLQELAKNNERKKDAGEDLGGWQSALYSFIDSTSFGLLSSSLYKDAERGMYEYVGLPKEDFVGTSQSMAKTLNENKVASFVGNVGGTLLPTGMVSKGVKAALGTIKGFGNLAPWIQNAISDAVTFGSMRGTRTAIAGGDASDIATETLRGALGGATGSFARSATDFGLTNLFTSPKVSRMWWVKAKDNVSTYYAKNVLAGIADAGGDYIGDTAVALATGQEMRSGEELLGDMAVAFIYGTIRNASSSKEVSKKSKTALENEFIKYAEDYRALDTAAKKASSAEGFVEIGEALIQRGEALKQTLEGTMFPGQKVAVKNMSEWIDAANDGIRKKISDVSGKTAKEASGEAGVVKTSPVATGGDLGYNQNSIGEGSVVSGREVDNTGIRGRSEVYDSGESVSKGIGDSGTYEANSNETEFGVHERRSGEIIYASDSEGIEIGEKEFIKTKDTAIKNEEGKPIAVYHATPEMNFEVFEQSKDIGFHFGGINQAKTRLAKKESNNGRVVRAYLNIKNPIRARLDINSWKAHHTGMYLWSEGYLTDAEWAEIQSLEVDGYDSPAAVRLREMLAEKGYDGIVYPNGFEGDGDSYIAFSDDQIIKTEIRNAEGANTQVNNSEEAVDANRASTASSAYSDGDGAPGAARPIEVAGNESLEERAERIDAYAEGTVGGQEFEVTEQWKRGKNIATTTHLFRTVYYQKLSNGKIRVYLEGERTEETGMFIPNEDVGEYDTFKEAHRATIRYLANEKGAYEAYPKTFHKYNDVYNERHKDDKKGAASAVASGADLGYNQDSIGEGSVVSGREGEEARADGRGDRTEISEVLGTTGREKTDVGTISQNGSSYEDVGLDLGEKTGRDSRWGSDDYVKPKNGSSPDKVQKILAEYGIKSNIISEKSWGIKYKEKEALYTHNKEIYIRNDLDSYSKKKFGEFEIPEESIIKSYAVHEALHVMRQSGNLQYIGFLKKFSGMLNAESPDLIDELYRVAEKQSVDVGIFGKIQKFESLTAKEQSKVLRAFDELNARIYGSRILDEVNADSYLSQFFTDKSVYEEYLEEMDRIHEDFKKQNNNEEAVDANRASAASSAYSDGDGAPGAARPTEVAGEVKDSSEDTDADWFDEYVEDINKREQVIQDNRIEDGKIYPNMPDDARTEILNNTELDIVEYDEKTDKISEENVVELENTYKSRAQQILKPLAEKFGVFKEYSNSQVELEFNYSKSSLRESIHTQNERNPNFSDFAKMLSVFDEVVTNAQLIEAHTDKYEGTTREDAEIEQVHILLGAFKDGDHIVPVEFNVKEYKGEKGNKLYVSVTLKRIEADLMAATAGQNAPKKTAKSTSKYSLTEIVKNINPEDGDFLRYIPDKMLSKEQIASKKKSLEKDGEKISRLRKKEERMLPDNSAPDTEPNGNKKGSGEVGSKKTKDGKKVSKVRTNTIEKSGIFSEEELKNPELAEEKFKYRPVSEDETQRKARERVEAGREEALEHIKNKEDWDGTDTDTAFELLKAERADAAENGDWVRVGEIARLIQKRATRAGQEIQAHAKYTRTAEKVIVEAAEQLEFSPLVSKEDIDLLRELVNRFLNEKGELDSARMDKALTELLEDEPKERRDRVRKVFRELIRAKSKGTGKSAFLSETEEILSSHMEDTVKAQEIMKTVSGAADLIYSMKEDGEAAKDKLIELIKRQAAIRGHKISRANEKRLLGEDFEFLYETAEKQLRAITEDYIPRTVGKKLSTVQSIGQLLQLPTYLTNIISNRAFGTVDKQTSNAFAIVFDRIIGLVTKQKTVGYEHTFGHGISDAGKKAKDRAKINASLDLKAGEPGRYGTGTTRTFKSDESRWRVTKFLSNVEKLLAYELNVPDEAQKGRIRRSVTESLIPLVEKGTLTVEEATEIAADEARYRTFQDDNLPSKILGELKKVFNHIGTKDFGAGDFVCKYTQVAGALIERTLEYSPVGYLKGIYNLGEMWRNGISPKRQRKAALAFARGTTGTGLILISTLLSSLGIVFRDEDESDDNIRSLNSAEGVIGTKINLSALGRLLGGQSTKAEKGDTLLSIDRFEPFNMFFTVGAEISKAENKSFGNIALTSITGAAKSIGDLSVMQTIDEFLSLLEYSDNADQIDVASEFAIFIGESTIGSFIPSLVRRGARAFDNNYRDAYADDSELGIALRQLGSSIPGVRNTLPKKLDNFGYEKTYTDNTVMNALNALALPFEVSAYKKRDVSSELERVRKETGNTNIYPPKSAPYSIKYDGEKYVLHTEARERYQKTRGNTMYRLIFEALKNEKYKELNAEQQAAILEDFKEYATDKAKDEYFKSVRVEYERDSMAYDADEALLNGVKISDFYIDKNAKDEEKMKKKRARDERRYEVIAKKYGISYEQFEKVAEAMSKGKTKEEEIKEIQKVLGCEYNKAMYIRSNYEETK